MVRFVPSSGRVAETSGFPPFTSQVGKATLARMFTLPNPSKCVLVGGQAPAPGGESCEMDLHRFSADSNGPWIRPVGLLGRRRSYSTWGSSSWLQHRPWRSRVRPNDPKEPSGVSMLVLFFRPPKWVCLNRSSVLACWRLPFLGWVEMGFKGKPRSCCFCFGIVGQDLGRFAWLSGSACIFWGT